MRLIRLQLSNFRQHVDSRIDFDSGITGIIGANGSGKSTILEAIAWALYGMPAARGKVETIRSYRPSTRPGVRVDLEFELGGHRYLVSRTLRNAEVFLDGSASPIANSISGVSDFLRRRLGMSREEFFHTYFTGQKELGVMAAMGPAERAKFLSRVLGYERLRDAQDLVRKRRSTIDAEARGLRAGMPDPEVVIRTLMEANTRLKAARERVAAATAARVAARAKLDELTPQWEAMQLERDALQAILADLRVEDQKRMATMAYVARLEIESDDVRRAREDLASVTSDLARLTNMRTELQDLDRAANEEARRKTLAESLRALGDELARLEERREKIATAPTLEAESAEELARVRTELEQVQRAFEDAQADWIRDKQEVETKRQALIDRLRDVEQQREQIVDLGENGTCPICARPLGTHFRSVLELLDEQIQSITVDGKFYRSRIEQLAKMPVEVAELDERRRASFEQVGKLERRLARVQAAVQELATITREITAKEPRREALTNELATIAVSYDPSRHRDVRALVEKLNPLATRAAKLSAQLEREPEITEELARNRSALATIEARIHELDQRRIELSFSEQSFGDVRSAYEAAAAAFRTAELTSVSLDSEVATARAALASAEHARAELARGEARLAELKREHRLHDELDRAFGDIRTDLNQEMRPELSDRASRYIRELTDGRYSELELDDQYNVIVLEDGIPKPVISGGEEDLANLVLRLAISEMIAERAGQPFSLLILDEVFGSLDETRRHNVVDLLRRLQDRFEQVILITHIESVREGLDRVITVQYDDETGASRVEAETTASGALLDEHVGAAD